MSITRLASDNPRVNYALATPSDLSPEGVAAIGRELRQVLADVFALYIKTKNFHWHMNGPHFRDYFWLLDEHADQIFAMIDELAERSRKTGSMTLRSVSDISRHQRLLDNNEDFVAPQEMIDELASDNRHLIQFLRAAHAVCTEHNDIGTASLIEKWIDGSERRVWFLFEASREV